MVVLWVSDVMSATNSPAAEVCVGADVAQVHLDQGVYLLITLFM